jgi:hypothetical protein
MQTAARITSWVVRLTGMTLVLLGLAIWTHRVPAIVPVHMGLGLTFVVALWVHAGVAARSGARLPLVTMTALWGLLVVGFGIGQRYLVLGPRHWLVEVAHLLVGIVAMALAARLGAQIRRRGTGSAGMPAVVPNDTSRHHTPSQDGVHAAHTAL